MYATGWRSDLEVPGLLKATALKAFRAPSSVPDLIDPTTWLKIEDQQQTSSCVGHAGSSAAEVVYWFATKGQEIQLSRWWAYITAQRIDGLEGRDQGAMISGVVQALEKSGICLEELCKFTGQYFSKLPAEAAPDAETRQVMKHVQIESSQAAVDWIGGGMGAVIVGVPCGDKMMNVKDTLDTVDEGGGGHALAVVGYNLKAQKLRIPGSWGTQYANKGSFWVTFKGFDRWCAQTRNGRSEVWGITNMETPEPQELDWLEYFNV